MFGITRVPDGYQFCIGCGTFISMTADPSIYTQDYWSNEHGHSTLYEQCYNCDLLIPEGATCSKSKFILDRIASERGTALEIGCAPGRMLYWLKWAARFKTIWGNDTSNREQINRISCNAASNMETGEFPKVADHWLDSEWDYILASDVFEHSTEPIQFLSACARLLKSGGQLFMVLPLADNLPLDSRMFNAIEHAYLHTKANLQAMLEDAGFERIAFDRWCEGHDSVTGFKR